MDVGWLRDMHLGACRQEYLHEVEGAYTGVNVFSPTGTGRTGVLTVE